MQTAKQRHRSNQLMSNINLVSFFGILVVLLYKSPQDRYTLV